MSTLSCASCRERTSVTVMPEQFGPPTWRRTGVFRYCGVRRVQHEVVVLVRRDVTEPPVEETGRLDHEREDYFDYRWWPRRDVADSTETFYPGSLPRLLAGFLEGDNSTNRSICGPEQRALLLGAMSASAESRSPELRSAREATAEFGFLGACSVRPAVPPARPRVVAAASSTRPAAGEHPTTPPRK